MTFKNKSIVVLLSGGLDSSTVTGIAKKAEAKIFGLSFDYGQRHKKNDDGRRTKANEYSY